MQGGKQFVFLHVLTVHLKRTRWTRSQAKRRIWDSVMRLLWYSPAAEIRNVWILISIQSSRLKCPLFWTTMQTTRMSQHLKLIKRSTCRCNRISVISAFSLYQIFIETLRFCLAHTNTKTEKKKCIPNPSDWSTYFNLNMQCQNSSTHGCDSKFQDHNWMATERFKSIAQSSFRAGLDGASEIYDLCIFDRLSMCC